MLFLVFDFRTIRAFRVLATSRDIYMSVLEKSVDFYPGFSRFTLRFLRTAKNRIIFQMWENTDQKNSKYEHFLRSDTFRTYFFRHILGLGRRCKPLELHE